MQFDLEQVYSRQLVNQELQIYCQTQENILEELHQRVTTWLNNYGKNPKDIYLAKTERIDIVRTHLDNIAWSIFYSVLSLGNNEIQPHATKLGLMFTNNTLQAVKLGAELLCVCDGVFYEIIRPKLGTMQTFKLELFKSIPQEIQDKFNQTLYPMPMLNLPNVYTTNSNGGYELIKSNLLLGNRINRHNKPLNLSVINKLQEVAYTLDHSISDVDQIKTDFESDIDEKNFNLSVKQNRVVYDTLADNKFYFVWAYDKRGRVYSRGYHCNIQGDEYRKAMLKFAKYEKLTDRGWYWLKIDLANAYGKDKELFSDRVKFIDENIDDMLSNKEKWINDADEPLLFQSALLSYEQSLKTGMSNHIVRLDATCSGPQLMSVIMRDKEAMERFNVLGDIQRHDYYTEVAQATYELTKDSSIWGENPNWSDIRKQTKKSTMTFWYNSEAKPQEFFGKDTAEIKAYYSVLENLTKGAVKLKQAINDCWSNERLINEWTLPDGHTAYCPVMKVIDTTIEVKEFREGTIKFKYRYEKNEAGESEARSLAPNVIHSLDAFVCRNIITILGEKGIAVSPIHDSFGVHPNYCDDLRQVYRSTLARLYREPIIDNILNEITGESIYLDKEPYDACIEQAIKSNTNGYYIC